MGNFSHYHFFLGGHDAEMMEIKKILSENGCNIHDANLQWGAKISAYKEALLKLMPHEIPVFIELEQDIPVSEGALIIDHHGEFAGKDKLTVIEQIARLLKINLTRKQQLISANDRGYIRGMLTMGAKPEEIEEIRALDRKAQGITEQDSLFADEAIAQIKEPCPGLALIESETKRTAAIIDKIWNRYQTFIIKTPDEVHISGPGKLIDALRKHYESLAKEKPDVKFWFGGMLPNYGFFGSNYYDEEELLNMAQKETNPISQHVFLFPFKVAPWQDQDNKNNAIIAEKGMRHESVGQVKDVFRKLTQFAVWEYKSFLPFTAPQNYNEYSYFHDYVRVAIFEKLKMPSIGETRHHNTEEELFSGAEPNFVSCLLQRCAQKGLLNLFIKKQEQPYELTIDTISLRLFETGIAILAIELSNYNYCDLNDIQRINDYGRRVYPQFFGKEGEEIDRVKESFLADRLEIVIEGMAPIKESFQLCDFLCHKHEPPYHLHIGKHITELMGENFTTFYRMEPIIDDRMFTVCWYRGDAFLTRLTQNAIDDKGDKLQNYPFEYSEDWYRFIYLDGNNCYCPDERMRRHLIETSTYRRWNPLTLYGITRYSTMCLCNSGAPEFIQIHMRRQYRLMAELLLAQRASIITFFCRVAEISRQIDQWDEGKDNALRIETIVKDIRKLNGDFLGFKNRLWFKEVTPQEQGIEMYDMAMKNMALEKQMEELTDEIKTLYEYAEMQYDRIRSVAERTLNKRMLKLTQIAAIAVPFTIMLAFWGMSFDFIKVTNWQHILSFIGHHQAIAILASVTIVLIIVVVLILLWWVKRENTKK